MKENPEHSTEKKKKEFLYQFNKKSIFVTEEDYFLDKKHHTRRYKEAMKIIEEFDTKQMPIYDLLDWFFNENESISVEEKSSIHELHYCVKSQILVVRTENGDNIYARRNNIAKTSGWYFYVTGINLPKSHLCEKIDEIITNDGNFEPDKFELCLNLDDFLKQVSSDNQNFEELSKNIKSTSPQNGNYNNLKKDYYNFLKDKSTFQIRAIKCGQNENSFLVSLNNFEIICDIGIYPNTIQDYIDLDTFTPNAIFISHSHNDHIQGLLKLLEFYPNVPVILSKTTLAFFLYRLTHEKRDFNEIEKKLIKNAVIVKNLDTIPISIRSNINEINDNQKDGLNVGELKFFFAGHMPGALMMSVEYFEKTLLYTGDYTYYSFNHIPGIKEIRNHLQKKIDLLVVDGSFANEDLKPSRNQIYSLRKMAKIKADYKNDVLIASDPSSIGILIYLSLHRYFIYLKEKQHYENRPIFNLSRNIYDYAKILLTIEQDLSSSTRKSIKRELNPFCSAMINWIYQPNEKHQLISKLRNNHKNKKRSDFIIFDDQNLRNSWTIDFFKQISKRKHNVVYLGGRMTSECSIELISGSDNIGLTKRRKNSNGELVEETFDWENRATIQNRFDPDNIIVLHGDSNQLVELINDIKPQKIGFFHTNPRNLITIRNKLERFKFIKKTEAFYQRNKKVIRI